MRDLLQMKYPKDILKPGSVKNPMIQHDVKLVVKEYARRTWQITLGKNKEVFLKSMSISVCLILLSTNFWEMLLDQCFLNNLFFPYRLPINRRNYDHRFYGHREKIPWALKVNGVNHTLPIPAHEENLLDEEAFDFF